ncbi:thiamine pyrophosphokinase [Aureimonas sp. SA4125]|uniref:thiamine diphosphokinase n=1 Tax=Aureimonas sp. SA4125 TaxID=2826993 RepID=UPI001CC41ABC|nr:thiamine diphosphokinase [Aureimonas sp. SA4125]BDA86222.1 thiamine pyrophosphokinase [Aureimonas sp. SA4125]
MSCFTIFLAGAIRPTPALRQAIAGTRIIAADGGMAHAEALGVVPELWVGDFDSAAPSLAARFSVVPRETFARDKDRTDGELAIDAAIARGAEEILLVGAFGGPRTDHAFMHLILALRYASRGIAVALFDGNEHAVPLKLGPQRIDMLPGTDFSLLKFSDLSGLSISGAKWPLDDVAVPFSSILTQSNQALGPVEITLGAGTAVLLFQAGPAAP